MSPVSTRRALSLTGGLMREEFRPVYGRTVSVDRYALDPLAHLDDGHVRILDLETMKEVDFDPWPHQRELAAAWVDLDYLAETGTARWRNVFEEKSRQEGITWALAWLDLWALLYHPASGLVIHLKLKLVDDGGSGSTPESYFGKIRFMWERLPELYRAPLRFKLGQITNAYDSRSYLSAEGEDASAGRGGRYDRAVLDEAAWLTFGESIHASIRSAVPEGRFYNSTPFGEDNMYARLRKDRPHGYIFLTHHWSSHPVYSVGLHVAAELDAETKAVANEGEPGCEQCAATLAGRMWTARNPVAHRYPGRVTSPWYETAILDLTDQQVAQELDIDYSGSLTARVYPGFSERVHVDEEGFGYDPSLPLEYAIDYGIDATPVTFLQEAADEIRVVGEVPLVDNATPEVVTSMMLAEMRRIGVSETELLPEFTLQMLGVGDPSGEQRERRSALPLTADYLRLGFSIVSQPNRIAATILALTRLLNGQPKPLVISGPDCPETVENFKNNRWPTERDGRRKKNAREPLNDRHNHRLRALSYWSVYRFPPPAVADVLADATSGVTRRRRGARGLDAPLSYDMRL